MVSRKFDRISLITEYKDMQLEVCDLDFAAIIEHVIIFEKCVVFVMGNRQYLSRRVPKTLSVGRIFCSQVFFRRASI